MCLLYLCSYFHHVYTFIHCLCENARHHGSYKCSIFCDVEIRLFLFISSLSLFLLLKSWRSRPSITTVPPPFLKNVSSAASCRTTFATTTTNTIRWMDCLRGPKRRLKRTAKTSANTCIPTPNSVPWCAHNRCTSYHSLYMQMSGFCFLVHLYPIIMFFFVALAYDYDYDCPHHMLYITFVVGY